MPAATPAQAASERPRNPDGTFKPTDPATKAASDKPKIIDATPAILDFMGEFTENDREKQKKKAESEQPPAQPAQPAVKQDEKKVAAPAPAKKPEVKPAAPTAPTPLTAEQIAEASAKGFRKAMDEQKAVEKPKEPPVDPDAGIPEAEKERIQVLQHMEKIIPSKKGVADQYRSNLKKLSEYAANWQKSHPGETFDEDAEEHTEFFEKNQLYQLWDDDEYVKALADKISDDKMSRLKSEREKEDNQRLTALERENKVLKAQPVIATHQNVAARNYWKNIGGEFDNLVLENGTVDAAKEKALMESNPELYNATVGAAIRLNNLVEQAYLLKKGLIDFSAAPPDERLKSTDAKAYEAALQKFNDHQYLSRFALDQEAKMLQKPLEGQVNNAGQQFKPIAEYNKLPEAERERFWTFNEADLAALLSWDEGKKMKDYITAEEAKFNRWAAAKGLTPKESVLAANEAAQPAPEAPATQQQNYDEDEPSPQSTTSPKSATILQTGKKEKTDAITAFFN